VFAGAGGRQTVFRVMNLRFVRSTLYFLLYISSSIRQIENSRPNKMIVFSVLIKVMILVFTFLS